MNQIIRLTCKQQCLSNTPHKLFKEQEVKHTSNRKSKAIITFDDQHWHIQFKQCNAVKNHPHILLEKLFEISLPLMNILYCVYRFLKAAFRFLDHFHSACVHFSSVCSNFVFFFFFFFSNTFSIECSRYNQLSTTYKIFYTTESSHCQTVGNNIMNFHWNQNIGSATPNDKSLIAFARL